MLKALAKKFQKLNQIQIRLSVKLTANEVALSLSIRKTLPILILLSYLQHLGGLF